MEITKNKEGVSLKKHIVSLDKTLVSLAKKNGYDLSNHKAVVVVELDHSGSMKPLYKNGSVQNFLTRLMPIALKFDDNKELDVLIYSDDFKQIEPITLNNFDNYVENIIKEDDYHYGGTQFAPVLEYTLSKYFGVGVGNYDVLKQVNKDLLSRVISKLSFLTKKDKFQTSVPDDMPIYVMFLTDGYNSDMDRTCNLIKLSSKYHMFIQIIGIGDLDLCNFKKLSTVGGRMHNNTDFFKMDTLNSLTDEELYNKLMLNYSKWLKEINLI